MQNVIPPTALINCINWRQPWITWYAPMWLRRVYVSHLKTILYCDTIFMRSQSRTVPSIDHTKMIIQDTTMESDHHACDSCSCALATIIHRSSRCYDTAEYRDITRLDNHLTIYDVKIRASVKSGTQRILNIQIHNGNPLYSEAKTHRELS